MYEARENKQIKNRTIMKPVNKSKTKSCNKNIDAFNVYQTKRNIQQEIIPYDKHYEPCPYTNNWNRCTSSTICIPPHTMPMKGSGTSGIAPWNGVLLDAGYSSDRNATRLHVINSNFGGSGDNNGGNLHPGSQRLNKNHLYQAENVLKNLLSDENLDNESLYYTCTFDWNPKSVYGYIEDPVITCNIGTNEESKNFYVSQGDGMFYNKITKDT